MLLHLAMQAGNQFKNVFKKGHLIIENPLKIINYKFGFISDLKQNCCHTLSYG